MATYVGFVEQEKAPDWPTPKVVPAASYKRKAIHMVSPFSRLHHGKPCPYCGNPMDKHGAVHGAKPTREHVIPRSKGGKIVIVVCGSCNNAKGDMMPDEYIATLDGCRRTKTLIAIIGALIQAAAVERMEEKQSFSTTVMEEAFKAAAKGV